MSIARTLVAATLVIPAWAHAFSFDADSRYVYSQGPRLDQYSSSGELLGSLSMPLINGAHANPHAMAFGADGLLYVGYSGPSAGTSSVVALNAGGDVVRSYSLSGGTGSFAYQSDLVFAPDRESFYVSTDAGVFRYGISGGGEQKVSPYSPNAMSVMANGDLLLAFNDSVVRQSADGTRIGELTFLSDPLGVAKPFSSYPVFLSSVRGVAYDHASDTTFISMLGYYGGSSMNMIHKVVAVHGFTDVLKGIAQVAYSYPNEIEVTDDGHVLVLSGDVAVEVFDLDLKPVTVLGLGGQYGIAAMRAPIPEPASAWMVLGGLAAVCAWSRQAKGG